MGEGEQREMTAAESWTYLSGVLSALALQQSVQWWSCLAQGIEDAKGAVTEALDRLAELERRPSVTPPLTVEAYERLNREGAGECGEPPLAEAVWEPTEEQLTKMAAAVAGRINHSQWNGTVRGQTNYNHFQPADLAAVTGLLVEAMTSALEPPEPAQVMGDVHGTAPQCCACGSEGRPDKPSWFKNAADLWTYICPGCKRSIR